MPDIFTDIPVEGDWPSAEDMELRNTIIDELDALDKDSATGVIRGLPNRSSFYAS